MKVFNSSLFLKESLVVAILVYLLVGYMNEFIAENQVYYDINQPPLFDRGHNLIPKINRAYADYGVIGFLIYFIVRWGFKYPNTIVNYLWIISFMFLGRMIIMSVTQLPPAITGCSTIKPNEKLHFRLFRKGWNECLDYMFSGHTLHCVLIVLFSFYLSNNVFEKILISIACLIEIICIIGSRIHYTADVLVATMITLLAFYSWPGIDNIQNHIKTGGIYGVIINKHISKI